MCAFFHHHHHHLTRLQPLVLSLHIWWALKLSIVCRTVSVAAAAALCFALPWYLISFGFSVAEPCVLFFLFQIRVFPFGSSFSICHFRAWLGKAEGKNQLSGLITWNILFYFHKFGAAYLCVCMHVFVFFVLPYVCVCFFFYFIPFSFCTRQNELTFRMEQLAQCVIEWMYVPPFRSICYFCVFFLFFPRILYSLHSECFIFLSCFKCLVLAYFTFLHNI